MTWLLQDAAIATVAGLGLLLLPGLRRIPPGMEHVLWVLVAASRVRSLSPCPNPT